MTFAQRWRSVSPDDIRARAATVRHEARSDAALAEPADETLNEAAARAALTLRHGSAAPAAIALIAALAEATALTLALWGATRGFAPLAAAGLGASLAAAALIAVAACAAGWALGGYRIGTLRAFAPGFLRAAAGLTLAMGAVAAAAWSGRLPLDGLGTLWGVGLAALALARVGVAAVSDWCVTAGLTERRAVIVGGGAAAERLIRGLDARADNDIRICAIFDDRDDDRSPPLVAGARKLGGIAELVAFARVAHIDMLIVTLPLEAEQRILTLLGQLWVLPVDIRLSAYSSDFEFRRRSLDDGFIPVLDRPLRGGRRAVKRALDVAVASLALAALSPVMLAAALAIRVETRGPVIFRQQRHGYNHQPVEVWKFRSMRHEAADPTARKVVTRGDPRVTRVGRFIRKTSIDELPQLFNVLAGTLSLVGPRPHVLNAVSSRAQTFAEIVGGYSGRHRVPPGITGWAQINGWRGEIDDPEKLRKRFEHDLYYIENWSLRLDLYILAMTPLRLLRADNAC